MTGLERVIAAIKGNKSDFIPATLTLSLYGAKLTDCPLEKYYTDSNEYLKGQIEIDKRFSPDIIVSPFTLSYEGKAFGSTIKYFKNQPPNISKPLFNSSPDIKLIKAPNIDNDQSLQFIINSVKGLSSTFSGKTAIAALVTAPFDIPELIFGIDLWLEILLFERKKALDIIEITSEHFINFSNKLLDNGADFIASPMMFCNPKIVTEEIVKNVAIPTLNKTFSKIKGPIIYHHGGNPLSPFIHYFKDIPNIAGFILGITDNFTEARNIIGAEKVLMGNIEGPTLCKYPLTSIKKIVKRIIDNRKNDKHFIFSSSGADFSLDTTKEQIAMIFDTIREEPNE